MLNRWRRSWFVLCVSGVLGYGQIAFAQGVEKDAAAHAEEASSAQGHAQGSQGNRPMPANKSAAPAEDAPVAHPPTTTAVPAQPIPPPSLSPQALAQPTTMRDAVVNQELAAPEVDGGEEEELTFPRFSVGARLIAGAEWRNAHPDVDGQADDTSRQPFFLKQARVKLRAELTERIYMSFSADLEGKPPIRSAFMDAKFKRYLRVRVGRFKRPISRIELTSVGELPFPDRGIFNSALIERAGWGDRALGLMVHGKLKRPKLRYYAAVMNAAPTIDVDDLERLRGVDLLGRLEYRPIKGLSLGINGGHKTRESRVDGPNLALLGVGGDVQLELAGLRAVLEVLAAQNPYPPAPPMNIDRRPWAMVTMGYLTYDLQLSRPAVLQPVVACEWVDTDLDVAEDEALRVLAGVNLLWESDLRIMPRVEIVRPLGAVGRRSQVSSETYSLVFSLAL